MRERKKPVTVKLRPKNKMTGTKKNRKRKALLFDNQLY